MKIVSPTRQPAPGRLDGGDSKDPPRNSDDALLLFVKVPVAGTVKTRLTPQLSAHEAAELYTAMTEDLLARVTAVGGPDLILLYDPPEKESVIAAWLGPERLLHPQTGRDLGERMANAFAWAFDQGYERVLAAGTDIPGLDRDFVEAARLSLRDHDVVVGPSPDGGYSLIGLRREQPELFRGIAWSTSAVLTETLRRAAELSLTVDRLPPLADIDTFADLTRWWAGDAPGRAAVAPRMISLLRSFFRGPPGAGLPGPLADDTLP